MNPCHLQHLPLLPSRTITPDNRCFPFSRRSCSPRGSCCCFRLRTVGSSPSLTQGSPRHVKEGPELLGQGRAGGSGAGAASGPRAGGEGWVGIVTSPSSVCGRREAHPAPELWERESIQGTLPRNAQLPLEPSPGEMPPAEPLQGCLGAAPAPLPSLHGVVGTRSLLLLTGASCLLCLSWISLLIEESFSLHNCPLPYIIPTFLFKLAY